MEKKQFHEEMLLVLVPLIQALVDSPADVKVEVMQGEQTTVFGVTVKKENLGQIIGKQGKTAKSLRQLIHAMATKHRRRAVMEIMQ